MHSDKLFNIVHVQTAMVSILLSAPNRYVFVCDEMMEHLLVKPSE